MPNPLTAVLPTRQRRIAYHVFALAGLALGSVPVYCAATGASIPAWVLGALAVYAFIAGPLFGEAAAANASEDGRP
ncbi:MAG TPA: hypothetical protein VJL80_09800 [Aeromicrobium sp.]|nr:hypothetical protein [Aeromicrobium sp.]HKY58319.1 hypothetical protein [Aeromicrobium sp.]